MLYRALFTTFATLVLAAIIPVAASLALAAQVMAVSAA